MPRPDTSHWRRCDDEDCILCESRRREFDAKARVLCLHWDYPLTREVDGGDDDV